MEPDSRRTRVKPTNVVYHIVCDDVVVVHVCVGSSRRVAFVVATRIADEPALGENTAVRCILDPIAPDCDVITGCVEPDPSVASRRDTTVLNHDVGGLS